MWLHAKAVGEPVGLWNHTGIAAGLVGSVLPSVVMYFPVNSTGPPGSRYWTYINVPKADMGGSREQGTWMRFQQIECAGPNKAPPCTLKGWPMYWDTMWFARYPGANASDTQHQTLITGPNDYSQPSGFYAALLDLRYAWRRDLAAEEMAQLQLPSGNGTNGTFLHTQAIHSIVRSMITRQNTWHPRYGTKPGYGADAWHGLPDVFTSTAAAALEMGAMEFARGVIDNHFSFYVRSDGMIMHRGMQVPSSCRMLTLLALYHGYSGGDDALLLQHFDKAKALGEWLLYRRARALNFTTSDPRYGIPQGDAEAENYPHVMMHRTKPLHFLSSAAEMYRAFTEMGAVWQQVGKAQGRDDILKHASELLAAAPLLYRDLHASLNRTMYATGHPEAPRCWPFVAEVNRTDGQAAHPHRAYPELMYSGALTAQQVGDIYDYMNHVNGSITLGVPGWGRHISTRAPFGFAYGFCVVNQNTSISSA